MRGAALQRRGQFEQHAGGRTAVVRSYEFAIFLVS